MESQKPNYRRFPLHVCHAFCAIIFFVAMCVPRILSAETSPVQDISAIKPTDLSNINSSALTDCYHITQSLHSALEEYTNELIVLFDSYLYRRDKLTIDEMITQMLPVLKGFLAQTKSNVWTINRLAYLETFHEGWEQENHKAYQVITDYIDTTLNRIQTDMDELEELPLKAPSMTEVPLLMRHYQRTRELLSDTYSKLRALYATMSSANLPREPFSDEAKPISSI